MHYAAHSQTVERLLGRCQPGPTPPIVNSALSEEEGGRRHSLAAFGPADCPLLHGGGGGGGGGKISDIRILWVLGVMEGRPETFGQLIPTANVRLPLVYVDLTEVVINPAHEDTLDT